ncbi:MAG: TrkH family potassium uptake protein, partial [Gammaproteobacteria bacterium]|nr:TrkH family potassium uptake protein [Gammaproteobacteria bacterium]
MADTFKQTQSSERRFADQGIQLSRVFFVIGMMMLVLTLFMFPPLVSDLVARNNDWSVFAASAFMTGFLGLMLVLVSRGGWSDHVTLKEGFVLTVLSWIALCVMASIPFMFLGRDASVANALFEAVSGLTATGATVLTGLDHLPPGMLLWRSILQWIGGVGIVVMALVMLPFLRVGGMQLFRTENSDRSDKFMPRVGEVISLIAVTYLCLTFACGFAYYWAGMNAFDALNHAMTTVSTAGFSTHDRSFAHFEDNKAIHWIAIFFMLSSCMPLVLYVKMVSSRSLAVWNDAQVRGFVQIAGLAVFTVTLWYYVRHDEPFLDALRVVSFNVVSIISTTGYALGDYTNWGSGIMGLFFALMFLGGCTGSTTGGLKTFRLQVMMMTASGYIRQLMSPNRIVVLNFNNTRITNEIATSVLAYVTVMFL